MMNSIYTMFLLQTYTRSLKQYGEHARTTLRVLETLTYSCSDTIILQELCGKLDTLTSELKAKLPQNHGLVLRPQARLAARRRAKEISRKYSSLPYLQKRGRLRNDWRYQGRVGKKADTLRKYANDRKPEINEKVSTS